MLKKTRRGFVSELAHAMAEAIAEAVNEIGKRRAEAKTPDEAPNVAVVTYPMDELAARRNRNKWRKR